jgi:hypothetical protein
VTFALLVVGCGSTSSDSGSASGGTGGVDSGTDAGITTDAGSDPLPNGCDEIEDDVPAHAIAIQITNSTASAIFLPQLETDCSTSAPFLPYEVSDPAGAPVDVWAGGCGQSCEGMTANVGTCGSGCPIGETVRIEPGGTYSLEWSGLSFDLIQAPSSCFTWSAGADTISCPRGRTPAAGSYQVSVKAATACASCDCTPSAEGWCALESGGIQATAATLTTTASLTLPAAQSVEVVFQ